MDLLDFDFENRANMGLALLPSFNRQCGLKKQLLLFI